jgi:hypothetical protein
MDKPITQLVPFLQNLASQIEKSELTPRQLTSIAEFYFQYHHIQAVTNGQTPAVKDENSEEVMKYFFLGWYIYQFLNDKD